MMVLFIFSPPAYYPVFLPPPFRVFPVEVSIVSAPPAAAAARAAAEPLRIAAAIVEAWPLPGISVGIVAIWLPHGVADFPGISAGPL